MPKVAENSRGNRIAIVLSVDEDRLGAVIGTKGRVEKYLEKSLGIVIKIDSKKGKVIITADRGNVEAALKARMVVEAIANGISFEDAKKVLENPDYILEIIDISEYARSKRDLMRIKARLIGKQGKIKTLLEDELGVKIAIRNKYVAILGRYQDVMMAKEAVQAICRGSKYGRVLKKIENYKIMRNIYY